MASEQSNYHKAAEWLWSHKKKEMYWGPTVLTAVNPDQSAPKMTSVEAVSFFKVLEERGLIYRELQDGKLGFRLHESKEHEWTAFILELKVSPPKTRNRPSGNPVVEEKAPDLSEPLKWAVFHITKNIDHLKAAWLAVLSVATLSFLAGWFVVWNIVVTSKNAAIETLQTSVNGKNDKITQLQTDNDRLEKQNQDLKTVVAENATPLKKRTQILVTQLIEYVQRNRTNVNVTTVNNDYDSRFENRIAKVIQELDEAGLHSDKLNSAFDSTRHRIPPDLNEVEAVATELQELVKHFKAGSGN